MNTMNMILLIWCLLMTLMMIIVYTDEYDECDHDQPASYPEGGR